VCACWSNHVAMLLHLTVWCSSCISCVQFTDTDESKRDAHPMCCGSTHSHPSVHCILVLIIPLFPLSAHRCTSSLLADSVTQSLTASCFSWSGINSHARTRAHTHTDASTHKDVIHSLLYITTVPCRARLHPPHSHPRVSQNSHQHSSSDTLGSGSISSDCFGSLVHCQCTSTLLHGHHGRLE
jgi:hypothetical protein